MRSRGSMKGGTGACVRCEEAGTRPSARVGLAMSVFTHGVNAKGKPRTINHNQVFPVAKRRKSLSRRLRGAHGASVSRASVDWLNLYVLITCIGSEVNAGWKLLDGARSKSILGYGRLG